ncbi:6019_t:CDS:2, partial [Diversispora eburnea]
ECSKLQMALAEYNYDDIYNVDETGLFFKWNLIKYSIQKKIVLLIDNTGSHFNTKRLQKVYFDNSSKDEFDNEQESTHLQPIDAGIIHELNNDEETHYEETDEKVIDLINNLPEKDCVQRYFQFIDFDISTEENLTEEQSDSDDDEILPVSVKGAINGPEGCGYRGGPLYIECQSSN